MESFGERLSQRFAEFRESLEVDLEEYPEYEGIWSKINRVIMIL